MDVVVVATVVVAEIAAVVEIVVVAEIAAVAAIVVAAASQVTRPHSSIQNKCAGCYSQRILRSIPLAEIAYCASLGLYCAFLSVTSSLFWRII